MSKRTRMHNPPHPGEMLREDVIPGLGLYPQEVADQLGVPLADLTRVLSADTPVTADLALRIEAWLGVDRGRAELWLAEQASYDLWHARQRGALDATSALSATAPQSRNSLRCPSHPGEILREDVIPALTLTPQEAAAQLGVPLDDLARVLDGGAPVTVELAARIEAWLGVDHGGEAEFWLAMQAQYDLWLARQRGVAAEVTPAPGTRFETPTPEEAAEIERHAVEDDNPIATEEDVARAVPLSEVLGKGCLKGNG